MKQMRWLFGIPVVSDTMTKKPPRVNTSPSGAQSRSAYRDQDAPLKCKACGNLKTVKEFYVHRGKRHSHYASNCNDCRKIQMICRYRNITRAQYDWLLQRWDGNCSICETPCKPSIDHCHEAGHIRGILCTSCNSALGLLRDDVAVMARAIDYLKRAPVVLPSI